MNSHLNFEIEMLKPMKTKDKFIMFIVELIISVNKSYHK